MTKGAFLAPRKLGPPERDTSGMDKGRQTTANAAGDNDTIEP